MWKFKGDRVCVFQVKWLFTEIFMCVSEPFHIIWTGQPTSGVILCFTTTSLLIVCDSFFCSYLWHNKSFLVSVRSYCSMLVGKTTKVPHNRFAPSAQLDGLPFYYTCTSVQTINNNLGWCRNNCVELKLNSISFTKPSIIMINSGNYLSWINPRS